MSSVTSVSSQGVQFPPHGPRPQHTPPAMAGTAQLLGMSADDLRSAQRSGTTLADLAAEKGVSEDDLVNTVAADMKADNPEGAPELSETQLTTRRIYPFCLRTWQCSSAGWARLRSRSPECSSAATARTVRR